MNQVVSTTVGDCLVVLALCGLGLGAGGYVLGYLAGVRAERNHRERLRESCVKSQQGTKL